MNDITLVSAFVSNVNNRHDRSIDKYIEYGKLLLQSSINKIVFIDELLFDQFTEYINDNTILIKIKKEEIYLYEYKDCVTNFTLDTTNSSKDTLEYMFLMCSKTEWIKKAIELNKFDSDNYIWVDFGIRHIFTCSNEEFIEIINKVKYKNESNDLLRIGAIWNLNVKYNIDIYKNICWYFAGGVFGGNKKALLNFSVIMKNKCIEIITTKNTIMWEVNIWYLIYLETPELFDIYYCNHNNTLIENY